MNKLLERLTGLFGVGMSRLVCLISRQHLWVRRAVDPTMKSTTLTVIVCILCGRKGRDTHLENL